MLSYYRKVTASALLFALAFALTVAQTKAEVISFEDGFIVRNQISMADFRILKRDVQNRLEKRRITDRSALFVVFENCYGGELDAGLSIAAFLRDYGITTVGKGSVQSSCALAFLGGQKRLIGTREERFIWSWHAPKHTSQAAVAPEVLERLKRALRFFSGALLPEAWIDIAHRTNKGDGLVLVSQPAEKTQHAFFCVGAFRVADQCESLGSVSLSLIGITSD
jgi:hypothetical protein